MSVEFAVDTMGIGAHNYEFKKGNLHDINDIATSTQSKHSSMLERVTSTSFH